MSITHRLFVEISAHSKRDEQDNDRQHHADCGRFSVKAAAEILIDHHTDDRRLVTRTAVCQCEHLLEHAEAADDRLRDVDRQRRDKQRQRHTEEGAHS